ncbi:leucyl aminopeptidase family protein [Nocardioides dongxiaopingii]|uniref:leucyl aminopeptidase family protein n=1 Tax=Nocardioides sp. S-1144 TaxID=2582905 RepID=UPI00110D80C7|nr:leucyl aminopeptidase family protein [Nocardioides sp. S-1144]QCW49844.1 leucyl aminopeptidase family protein [Nocardioides sp. S-1144]
MSRASRVPTVPSLPPQVSPPQVALTHVPLHALVGVDVVALPVLPADGADGGADGADGADAPLLGPGAAELAELLDLDLVAIAEAAGLTGAVGESLVVPVPLGAPENADLRAVVLLGVGGQSPTDLRRAAATLARVVRDRDAVATTIAALDAEHGIEAAVVGLMLGSFSFSWRSRPPEHVPVRSVVLAGLPEHAADVDAAALDRALALGGAAWRARTLATVPSNLKNPAWLAARAEEIAEEAGLTCRVWDDEQLRAEGFGGIIGVGQGSATPPRLIRLDYSPPGATRKTPTVVLVGKGITFDTGGISIKPAQGMVAMKRDMTGGAVVLSAMAALGAVGCPVRVVGLVPAAENAVSGSATRPGDVLRHYGGRTSEVTNTDAEGRLVLGDALAYAVAELDPAVVVDVATLTGGAKVALGQQVGALFANDDALAGHLLDAGTSAGEPFWRLPLFAGYEEKLASKVADADNGPSGPGAVMAALFLQHFVGGLPWAHLDIASVGDVPDDRYEWTEGPSGFGARALLTWLGDHDPLAGVGA